MPLVFYGNVNLDKQELQNVAVENVVTKPTAANGFLGRLIFQTSAANPTGAGALYLKNAAAGTETWLDLSGEGAVSSVAASGGGGLTASYDAGTDATVVGVDYVTTNNIIRSAGSSSNLSNANDLTDAWMLVQNSADAVEDVELSKVKSAISAGVRRVKNGNATANHLQLDPSITTSGSGAVQYISSDSNGAIALKYRFTAADVTGTEAEKSGKFLKCTGANVSSWEDFVEYTDVLYNIELDQVEAGTPQEYGQLKLMKNDGAGGLGVSMQDTFTIRPLLTGAGDSNSLRLLVSPHSTITGLGAVILRLSATAEITNTLTLGDHFFKAQDQFIYESGSGSAVLASFISTESTDDDGTDSGAFAVGVGFTGTTSTLWPRINATYNDYIAAPNDSMLANRNYVLGAVNLTTAVTLQGNYNATDDPVTGVEVLVGHLYVVTTAGQGNGDLFWPILLNEGDIIIANQNNPANSTGWNVIQSNIDTATTTLAGLSHYPGEIEEGISAGADGGWAPATSWGNPGAPELKPYSLTWPVPGQSTISPVITTTKHGRISAVVNNTTITSTNAKDETEGIPFVNEFDTDIGNLYYAKQAYATVPDENDSYVITHALGSESVIIDVSNASTGETVFAEVVRNNMVQVTISIAGSHAAGAFAVTLHAA